MDVLGVAWIFKQDMSFLAEEARCQTVCVVCVTPQKGLMAEY